MTSDTEAPTPPSTPVTREEYAKSMEAITKAIQKLSEKPPEPSKLTSTTKRLLVIGIMTVGIIVSVGWAGGIIVAANALIILNGILNGGFALIKT